MIRFYINGTAGSKDGVEVTADNPITADGLFPAGSLPASKTISVFIRADEGESYNNVYYGSSLDEFTKIRMAETPEVNSQYLTVYNNGQQYYLLKKVTDTNIELKVMFLATSDEIGTVDTSLFFYAIVLDPYRKNI